MIRQTARMALDPNAELAEIVASILQRCGHDVDRSRVAMKRSAHASSCALYEVDIALEGIPPLLLKDLSPHAQTPEASGVRPSHLYDPLRELSVYRRILAPSGTGVRFFGGAFDRHSGRSLLLIERVAAMALDYVGEFPVWLRAARAIGAMHRRFHQTGIPIRSRAHLVTIDGAEMRFWIDRAAGRGDGPRLAAIVRAADTLCTELGGLRRTLAHGELYASNLLVDEERAYPVDWELAAIAPAAIDIAALTAGGWSAAERGALVEAWRDGLGDAGDASDRAVDLARLYLALRLLGWPEQWTPPLDEQHDWTAEALAVFERLGG